MATTKGKKKESKKMMVQIIYKNDMILMNLRAHIKIHIFQQTTVHFHTIFLCGKIN